MRRHSSPNEDQLLDEIKQLKAQLAQKDEAIKTLKQKIDQFRFLADFSSDWIYWINRQGRLEYVSPSCFEITGYTSDEFLSNPKLFQNIVHPEDKEQFRDKIKKELNNPNACTLQFRIVHKNGEERWIWHQCLPVFDDQGNLIGRRASNRDITEIRRSQQKLQHSEHLLRMVFDGLPDPLHMIDTDFRIVLTNKKLLELKGVTQEEIQGKYCYEVYQGRSEKCEVCASEKAMQTKAPITLEKTLPLSDGSEKYFEVSAIPILDEKGNVTHALEVTRDVTEKKQIEKSIRESEKKYREMYRLLRLIADNDPDMLWAKDLQGRFIFTNKALCEKLLGVQDVNEPVGKDDMYFVKQLRALHPDDPSWHNFGEACLDSDAITLKEKRPMHFEEYGNVMGKYTFLDVHKAPLRDEQGNIIGTVGSARDITEQKILEKKEEEARKKLKELATVIEQTNIAVIITDLEGTMEYVNRAFEIDTGYAYEEAIGQNPRILKSDKHPPEYYKEMWDTITAGKTWRGEFINRKKDGTEYHEDAIIFPIFDEQGNIIKYAGWLKDISKEKDLEKQIQQIQKIESIGVLTGGIAHDFNNLLTVINGYTELGLAKYRDDVKIRSILESIHAAGLRAANLTSQLLAFSRKQIITPKIIDINELISSMENMLKRLIEEHIVLHFYLEPGLPKIKADPVQIEQVLMNLVVNARDAIHEKAPENSKEKRIIIETSVHLLDDSYVATHKGSAPGMFVSISVTDNGIGMDEETKAKIFDPFFTTKEVGKGTGLGLSTVYGIVKQNNGSIFVYSEPDKGTTIKIYWPVAENQEENLFTSATENFSSLQGHETVLLVEDDPFVRNVGSDALREFGYHVLEAASGKEALELIEKENVQPALLITDLIMPSMSGKELAQILQKKFSEIKIIYTSGYTENHIVINGVLEKGINFIPKPYSVSDFISLVRTVLDKK